MRPRRNRLAAAAWCCMALAAAGCQTRPLVVPAPGMTLGGAFPDNCRPLDGYAAFRARLVDAVARRDEAAFRALFTADGIMRMNGIGGLAGASSWRMGGPDGPAVWKDLDEILELGCAVEDNGELLLPYTAQLGESPDGFSQSVAIRPAAVRSAPREDAAVLTVAPRGALLKRIDDPPQWADGWNYYALADGRAGYVAEEDVRNTLSSALVVVRKGGEWRVAYYGGYD